MFFKVKCVGWKAVLSRQILDFSFNSTEVWLLISSLGYNRIIKVTKNKKKHWFDSCREPWQEFQMQEDTITKRQKKSFCFLARL